MYGLAPYCTDVYEWYVPSNEIPEYFCNSKCGKSIKTNGTTNHEASTNKNLSDSTGGGELICPKCAEYSSYSIVGGSNPSCNDIKFFFNKES